MLAPFNCYKWRAPFFVLLIGYAITIKAKSIQGMGTQSKVILELLNYIRNMNSNINYNKITIVVLALVIGGNLAAPLDDPKHATVLRYENDNIGLDGYKFA